MQNKKNKKFGDMSKKTVSGGLIKSDDNARPFGKKNFYMMAGCIALIIIGFLLMLGGGSSVEGGFNPDIFSTRRIVVGPTITFLGFLFMAFAIMHDPDKQSKKEQK
jgi:hypothetical protein